MTIKKLFETLAEELKKDNGDRTVSICFWNNGWDTRDATEVVLTLLACRLSPKKDLSDGLRRRLNIRGFTLAS